MSSRLKKGMAESTSTDDESGFRSLIVFGLKSHDALKAASGALSVVV